MPRLIDHPRAPLARALQLAEAVDDLGGTASIDTAADKLGKKVSGAFRALISGTKQYGLIEVDSNQLVSTDAYRRYRLAYDDDERQEVLREIALTPPLFSDLNQRFSGRKIPDFLDKVLIREHGVHGSMASRVHGYFADAMKDAGLLDEQQRLVSPNKSKHESPAGEAEEGDEKVNAPTSSGTHTPDEPNVAHVTPTSDYAVTFTGPGLNTRLVLEDDDDFAIVQAILKKVESEVREHNERLRAERFAECSDEGANEAGDTQ